MLVAMRLINCQSWEDCTLEFSKDKPNILIADNSTGKSVIIKMLKITANPRIYSNDERKDLIRHGAECATLMCAFDDGAVSMTVVYPKKVIYRFRQNEEQGFVSYDEPPKIMLEHLGLITNSNIDFIVNIIDTDQDLYLVNTKSSGNVAMLKLLAEEPVLSEVLHKVDEITPVLKDKARLVTLRRNDLESTLESYQYIDVESLEQTIQKAESVIALFDKVIELVHQSEEINTVGVDNADYEQLLCHTELIQSCNSVSNLCNYLEYDSTSYATDINLIFVLNGLNSIACSVGDLQYDTTDYESVDKCLTLEKVLGLLKKRVDEFDTNSLVINTEEVAITEIRKEISDSGKIISCPIKGDVLYIDEKCVPYR